MIRKKSTLKKTDDRAAFIKVNEKKAISYKNIKKNTKFVKKLLTSMILLVNISELLGKHQEKQLG